ncbi:hypothetical protein KAI12_05065, partial [Candidatus Bathyarchaeota archaeon]|nr:hypothetical protein [Candidatus Bathyarchaeota archaeon]
LPFGTKLNTGSGGMTLSIVFYSIVGVLFLVFLPIASFPPHIAITGILSLTTAYGLLSKRYWVIWLLAAFFLIATTFALYTLYFVISTSLIMSIGMILFLVLTWAATAYIASKRELLER